MKKRALTAILIVVALLAGCASEQSGQAGESQLTILVTRDYGREIIEEKIVAIRDGDTVMDLMQDNFEVETAYGGGFINSIDGIASGYTEAGKSKKQRTKMDWFYYVDGIMAEVGSDQLLACDPNTISWDYHNWGGDMYVKTRIDAWPERLAGRDVEIACSESLMDEAEKISKAAEKTGGRVIDADVESVDMDNLERDAIFIGTWEDAAKNEFIRKAFQNRSSAGLYTAFEDEGLIVFDDSSSISGKFESGAAMSAIQKTYGSEAALLLIIGNDEYLVSEAVDILLDEEKIKGAFGLAVTNGGVYYVP